MEAIEEGGGVRHAADHTDSPVGAVGQPILVFTGGEPLLRNDLFILARHARLRGLPIALATNGTLVTRGHARHIAREGFTRVSISLDGPDAETHDEFRRVRGAFDSAIDGFIQLKELGISMQVNATVSLHDLERLEEIRELESSPSPAQPQPAAPQGRRGCLAGTGICFISHVGEVFPCGFLPVQAGHIRRQSFPEIWDSAPIFADLRDPDRLMGKCGACDYRTVCGGCRARAFGQAGHYLREEPFCNYIPASGNLT